jgi:hypothetical protein
VTDSPTATRTCSIRTITSSDASCNVAQHISLEMMCAHANAVTLHPMVRLPVQTTSAHVSELDNPCSLGKSIVTTPLRDGRSPTPPACENGDRCP